MKLRILEYKLDTTAAELKAKARKKGMYSAQYKKRLTAKLPPSKLQVWDSHLPGWVDVPTQTAGVPIGALDDI